MCKTKFLNLKLKLHFEFNFELNFKFPTNLSLWNIKPEATYGIYLCQKIPPSSFLLGDNTHDMIFPATTQVYTVNYKQSHTNDKVLIPSGIML